MFRLRLEMSGVRGKEMFHAVEDGVRMWVGLPFLPMTAMGYIKTLQPQLHSDEVNANSSMLMVIVKHS